MCITIVLWIIFLLCASAEFTIRDNTSGNLKDNLLDASRDDLILLFTGDTQFNFECVTTNKACKEASASIRAKYNLSIDCDMTTTAAIANNITEYERKKYIKECLAMESLYANQLSRDVMMSLIDSMRSKPTALVINGDLTSYGHLHELDAFQREWLHMPIRILPGLGNHDYENNVNDCVSNHCANRMLFWLVKYAEEKGLILDYRRNSTYFLKTSYTGSFAYSVTVCSESGRTCAKVIQLQHRPNYATRIDAPFTQWTITNSFRWLQRELENLRNSTMPIFINLHHMDAVSRTKIKQLLKALLKSRESVNPLRIFVLYAHIHHKHEMKYECAVQNIPFIYVGSIPNNSSPPHAEFITQSISVNRELAEMLITEWLNALAHPSLPKER
uniref:Calcineurin-like phosphoesterase domain-containing protein n=1 Tax=Ascaris lumbricoides TaxID=6252 RepID=A0A9J2P2C2_ASCLU